MTKIEKTIKIDYDKMENDDIKKEIKLLKKEIKPVKKQLKELEDCLAYLEKKTSSAYVKRNFSNAIRKLK